MDLKKKHWLFQKDKKGLKQVHGYISSWTFDRVIVQTSGGSRQKTEDRRKKIYQDIRISKRAIV